MKLKNIQILKGEMAIEKMHEKAQNFYNATDPFIVIEHLERNDKNVILYGYGFNVESAIECKVTFEELEEALIDFYNEYSE